ncbi:hypothetical protein THAOC_30413 [Thalassiosira oceanica]|uniref:Uncharacterized protein n=1 Tax=Thalassiosira oceanica TaxID=159749 RepID=K0RV20_THAOC|nr:hypothetical protein THAOC_30413 [Thalassiosira oceanica]|eukprot:EJK50562.1 hypothetical protein THAOC_30413 [Thalassiosira oceanica]
MSSGLENQNARIEALPGYALFNLKLINWGYIDIARCLPVDTTTLADIKSLITQHVGPTKSLQVSRADNNFPLDADDNITLRGLGFRGKVEKDLPVYNLHYDFTPVGTTESDPLLMTMS